MIKSKILIVDDEADILNLLQKSLELDGFSEIYKAENGIAAVKSCKDFSPDIIILDVMLPDIDGYEVCKQMRQFSHCPILFLSSKNDEVDKILGLAVGGDDYVTKPFSPKEIVYRVKAQLRRMEYLQKPLQPQNSPIKIGALTLDPSGGFATKDGKPLELTAREFGILLHLAENMGRVMSKERLYETVWGEDGVGYDNTIMVHVRHIREKIEDNPASPAYLVTVKGLGYKVVNPHDK